MRSIGCALEGFLRLLQGAAGVEALAADDQTHVIAVRLDHFDLRHIEHVHAAAGFGQHARLASARGAGAVLELLEERGKGARDGRSLLAASWRRRTRATVALKRASSKGLSR